MQPDVENLLLAFGIDIATIGATRAPTHPTSDVTQPDPGEPTSTWNRKPTRTKPPPKSGHNSEA